MPPRPRAIHDFADAVGAAVGLQELYGRFAAAVLLDDDGAIVDMRPFAGEHACIACAIEWAINLVDRPRADRPRADRIVLLSGEVSSVRAPKEDDIRVYQELGDELDHHGFELVDWVQTDGTLIRSLTFTCDVAPHWDEEPA
jgi:hypothetical protein